MYDAMIKDAARRPGEVDQEPADPVQKLLQITCARCHELAHDDRAEPFSCMPHAEPLTSNW